MLDGWKGVVVIVACLTMLAVLARIFHDQSGTLVVAAVASVQILLAWVTKPPQDKTPPPVTAILFFIFCGFLIGGCTATMTQREAQGAYLAEQLQCVDQAPTREAVDACRKGVSDRWTADAAVDGAK